MLTTIHKRGFTIVELLVVIVVIAILATISVAAYANVQVRARDSLRVQDMSTIKKTLLMYALEHGGAPKTDTFGGSAVGGWNMSSRPNWLAFLEPEYGKMPVDPVNTGTGDPNNSYQLTYFYYCYYSTKQFIRFGYWSEQTQTRKYEDIPVDSCL